MSPESSLSKAQSIKKHPSQRASKRILDLFLLTQLFFAASLWGSCRFDTKGLDSVPDSGLPDAMADRPNLPDALIDGTTGCTEGQLRCGTMPSRVERCEEREWVLDDTCEFGCASDPAPHCGDPVFQCGIQNSYLDTNTEPFNPGTGQTVVIDTDQKTVTGNNIPDPLNPIVVETGPDVPDILVLTFPSIHILEGVHIEVHGTRALALGSKEDFFLLGTIDAGAHGENPGPGGSTGGNGDDEAQGEGRGGRGIADTWGMPAGGGGAGYVSAGGQGGAKGSAIAGSGGSSYGSAAINTLVGGSGAGASSSANLDYGIGGAGGGAIILFSRGEIVIGPNASISVGGGGGRGGGVGVSGGGGGSGGSILLEAPLVKVLGTLASNGGGGGGSNSTDPEDEHGQDGQPSSTRASGGNTGGAGGAGDIKNGDDGGTETLGTAGGGGGSCGRLRINTNDPPILDEDGDQATFSPNLDTPLLFGTLNVE